MAKFKKIYAPFKEKMILTPLFNQSPLIQVAD
jgi:hypothetical protein